MKGLPNRTPPLSQAQVIVLVEDVLTEVFFIHVFRDPRLKFVTAGGKRALRVLLHNAQLFPRDNVLGVLPARAAALKMASPAAAGVA